MGYDMTVAGEVPQEELDARDATRRAFDLAVAARDEGGTQEEVSAAYEAMCLADTTYFRLNIWGMREMRSLMDDLGALRHNDAALPDFDDPDVLQAFGEGVGIEARKLCSNDGWLVTEEECDSAASVWEALVPEQRAEFCVADDAEASADKLAWVERWFSWLRVCSRRGGFRVY